jgi:hypothetical protein
MPAGCGGVCCQRLCGTRARPPGPAVVDPQQPQQPGLRNAERSVYLGAEYVNNPTVRGRAGGGRWVGGGRRRGARPLTGPPPRGAASPAVCRAALTFLLVHLHP